MKTGFIFISSLAAAIAGAQAVVGNGSTGHGGSSPFNYLYDRQHESILVGTVTGRAIARPAQGLPESVTLYVKSTKGRTYTVELGPRWFVANQVAKINLKDQIKVIGSPQIWQGQHVLVAKQVVNRKNGKVLAVRDLDGYPYWVAKRTGVSAQPPSDAVGGTVLSTNTVNVNGTPYSGFVMKTPNGNVNIVTAPTWYTNGQDYVIQPGNYVQIVRSARPLNVGYGVVLADTMYTNGTAYVFQNNGGPVWYGSGN